MRFHFVVYYGRRTPLAPQRGAKGAAAQYAPAAFAARMGRLAGQRPALTAGAQRWDYLYAADAAEAFWRMAVSGRNGAVYPLGGGRAQPLRRYMETLRDAIDPALPLGLGEIPYGPRQVMHLEADLTALQRDTGFRPRTSFAEGIGKTIEWIRNEQP